MPSDDRTRPVLAALADLVEAFRATLTTTAEDVTRLLDAHAAGRKEQQGRYAEELGPFAVGRLNVERFGTIFGHAPSTNGAGTAVLRRARETLTELLAREEALYSAVVEPGAQLYAVVAARLAEIGRAFAAARVAREVRAGVRPAERHLAALEALPFAEWTRAERQLAPALMVEVHGADLRPAGLAEFLDGRLKLVLLVTGDASPAPLARLVAPSTYVQQAEQMSDLAGFAAWRGPGIAALVPATLVRFTHDPALGPTPAERLRVSYTPQEPPRRTVAGMSVAQQLDELAMLTALAAPPQAAGSGAGTAPAAAADPAERLAAWLLTQAGLGSPG
jgi:hypothetical protein